MRFLLSLLLLIYLAATSLAEPIDYRANLKALHEANHPWAVFALAQADRAQAGASIYGDSGQWQAIAYVMTGDAKYGKAAAEKILAGEAEPVANSIREGFANTCIVYEWLRPILTTEQDATYRRKINRVCEWCFEINTAKYVGGWNYADSDQTTGQYLGLVLADRVLGTEWANRPEALKAREALRDYCLESAGGEWVESGRYNLGTLHLLILGTYAIGIEQFPEVEALIPQIVDQQLATMTPDGKQAYQWGDEEEPRGLAVDRRVKLWAMLAGLTGDARLYAALDQLIAGKEPKSYLALGQRALYLYRPQPYLRAAEGNGHFLYRKGGALLAIHFPKRLGVQHEVTYTTDLQLYLDGEWALTRPLGYGTIPVSGDAGNSPLFAGLSAMQSRGPLKWSETATGCEVTGGTSGPLYGAGYYNPPPAFCEHTRKLTYAFPGKLTVTDSFKGSKPTRLDRYRAADRAKIEASPLWQQVWHCPVEPVETPEGFTWKLPSGKVATLTAPQANRTVIDEREKWGANTSQFRASELKWQIRFASDEPVCEMVTTLEVR
jgi:hypothetical protein